MSRQDGSAATGEPFGVRLRKAREARGLTQSRLATEVAKTGLAETSSSEISRYERGDVKNPALAKVAAFAQALDVPLSEFTGATDHGDRLARLETLVAQIWELNTKALDAIQNALATLPETIATRLAQEERGVPRSRARAPRGASSTDPASDAG